jgi:opacity protein-like surface antigen
MRTSLFFAFAVAAIFPSVARAAAEGETPKEAQHGIDVMGQAALEGIRSSQGSGVWGGGATLGLRALYRLTPRLAIGGEASRTFTSFASDAMLVTDGKYYATQATSLWRGGAVLQYDYAVLGPLRAWVAGGVGIAFASDHYVATNRDLTSHALTDVRVAPWLGASTGLEVRPIKYASIGLRAGALHAAFGTPAANGSGIPGAAQSIYGGLDLGIHYPVD